MFRNDVGVKSGVESFLINPNIETEGQLARAYHCEGWVTDGATVKATTPLGKARRSEVRRDESWKSTPVKRFATKGFGKSPFLPNSAVAISTL